MDIVEKAIIIIGIFGVFLLLREVNCWYFKINARINIEKDILSMLKKISSQLEAGGHPIKKIDVESNDGYTASCATCSPEKTGSGTAVCPDCGTELTEGATRCPKCKHDFQEGLSK